MAISYEKELLLNEYDDQLGHSMNQIVVQYAHLPPDKVWQLRNTLAKANNSLEVVRKRVFLKAASKNGIEFDPAIFKGSICVVYINQAEPQHALKEVFNFKKSNPDFKLGVVCGRIDGKIVTGSEVEVLSSLPTLDEMRAQFIALLVTPMSQMLSVLEAKLEAPLSAEPETQTE